ncbi:UNVERIFIED_CONTAM: hypothetical protein FKN15_045670 [Acipenser sinensis]
MGQSQRKHTAICIFVATQQSKRFVARASAKKFQKVTLKVSPRGIILTDTETNELIDNVSIYRASAKKFQKVTLKVSPRGIILTDTETNELIDNVSIYRISYCTADKAQDKVFAYVAQSQFNETLECHAFLCPKKKIDVDDGLDDAFSSSNVDGANTATDWQSPGPELSAQMPLSTGVPSSD